MDFWKKKEKQKEPAVERTAQTRLARPGTGGPGSFVLIGISVWSTSDAIFWICKNLPKDLTMEDDR